MKEILFGTVITIASIFFIIFLFNQRDVEDKKTYYDYWNLAMNFKGWVGGILFLIIGIILILKGIKNLL